MKHPCMRLLLFLALSSLLLAIGCGGGGGGGGSTIVSLSSVTALYPSNGANWNDYVSSSGGTATDSACDAGTDTACVHGGEKRVVTLSGATSCSGISAQDSLGVFDWTCDASTGTARVISTGLKEGKNLSDLLDFATPGWKAIALSVSVGGTVHSTETSTSWWSNPVAADNDGGSLATSGTVYLVTSSMTGTYTFDASKVALVTKPGTTITGPAAGANSYAVSTSNHDFIWFEGSINATGDGVGLRPYYVRYSALRNVRIANAVIGADLYSFAHGQVSHLTCDKNSYGLQVFSSSNNSFSDITASNSGDRGVYLSQASSNNTMTRVTAFNNGRDGISVSAVSNNNSLSAVNASNNVENGLTVSGADGNTLSGVVAANNGNTGVSIGGSTNSVLVDITAANNLYGVDVHSNSYDNTIIGITSANNVTSGLRINLGWNNVVAGLSAPNNEFFGLYLSTAGTGSNTISDIATAHNASSNIVLSDTSYNTFTGVLKVGNPSGNCIVTNGTDPGLDTTTCANNGTSNATLVTDATVSASFVGKLTSDDTANGSDTSGHATFPVDPTTFDWSLFDNALRGWGKDGTVGLSDSRGQWINGAGAIWDWSLLSGDTVLKAVLSLPSGNTTHTHTWSNLSTTTFLRHAVEVLNDGIGNDNGLCESGETCLYTPNIGSYQGHGSLVSAGAFANGTVTGVTLLKYTTNGR